MYTFPNGKRYIGITSKTLSQRQGKNWQRYERCTHLWRAIQKYGYQQIVETILFKGNLTAEEAGRLETYFIAMFNSSDPNYGCNIQPGGNGILPKTIGSDRIKILQEQMREIGYKNKGRIVSDETREKQRLAKLGKKRNPHSQETKNKISNANCLENISEETRRRKSMSKMKRVIAENKITGEMLDFDSVGDAAEYFKVRESSVSRWVSGNRNPKNQFSFRFASPTTTE